MDIMFENSYLMTKERYMDWAKHPIKKNYFYILWLALMLFSLVLLVSYVLEGEYIYSFLSLIYVLFCIYRAYFRAKIMTLNLYRLLSNNQGAKEWKRTIQFTECITVIEGNTTAQYQWGQIKELKEDNQYIILVMNKSMGIRLEKTGFTKGDYEGFIRYIKDKIMINIKDE